MPQTKDGGWLLDERPLFSPEQWAKIQDLIQAGKKDEANKMMLDILEKSQDVAQNGRVLANRV